jgi:drug/metabolite transporter (DMT)-like permease
MTHLYGLVLMFLAACSFGAAAIIIKLAYRTGLQPAVLLPLQNIVAMACLWPILLISNGFPRLKWPHVRRLLWQGLIGNFGISLCYYFAAQRIDVSLLSIILFTYPGLVLLYQMTVENRRVASGEFLALILSLIGGTLAANPFHSAAGSIDGLGLLLAVGAAATYAFMNVYGEKLTRDLSSPVITTTTTTISTLAMLAVLPRGQWFSTNFSNTQWLLILASAMLSTVLPMNLMYVAIRKIGAFHASVVSIAELPCILILAFIILHERMSLWQMLGGALILISVVLLQTRPGSAEVGPATDAC